MEAALPILASLKWLAIYLGPVIAVILIYLKGLSAGKNAKQIELDEAHKALETKIRAAEAKNQFLEKERYDKVEAIHDAGLNPADLLKLWTEGPWGSGNKPTDPSKKTD